MLIADGRMMRAAAVAAVRMGGPCSRVGPSPISWSLWLTHTGQLGEVVFMKDARVRYNAAAKAAILLIMSAASAWRPETYALRRWPAGSCATLIVLSSPAPSRAHSSTQSTRKRIERLDLA